MDKNGSFFSKKISPHVKLSLIVFSVLINFTLLFALQQQNFNLRASAAVREEAKDLKSRMVKGTRTKTGKISKFSYTNPKGIDKTAGQGASAAKDFINKLERVKNTDLDLFPKGKTTLTLKSSKKISKKSAPLFTKLGIKPTADNVEVFTHEQKINNVPVLGSDFTTRVKNGNEIVGVSGQLITNDALGNTKKKSATEAETIAKNDFLSYQKIYPTCLKQKLTHG